MHEGWAAAQASTLAALGLPWAGGGTVPSWRRRGYAAGTAAVLGGWMAFALPNWPSWLVAALAAVWAAVAWVDGTEAIIPNRLVALTVALGGLGRAFGHDGLWPQAVLMGVGLFLFLGVAHLWSRGGLGMGDVKFGAALGFALAWPTAVWTTALGLWTAAAWAGIGMWLGRRPPKRAIALGPFLVLGAVIGLTVWPRH
ncbi:MAG: A24 family peptidase [Firmicutes bacterium]|nr:prepilin peptidase [Alicyclobacillaceae bacterium]MCL6496656.1 A24 family peptidase [Bacillota bacterium]